MPPAAERGREPRWGVLLLAHGAPDRPEDIPEFLLRVRNGRPLPPPAVEEIARRYALIGGSPLLQHTRRQAEALAARLGRPVSIGMRNWRPYIAEGVAELSALDLDVAVAICLAPHNSRTSVGLYRQRLDEALRQSGARFRVQFVEHWHDHPLLIRAFAENLHAALVAVGEPAPPVILTAHSVPEKTIAAGDPYDHQVRETAAQVAAAVSCADWTLAYQSQGMTADPWIGPTVESVIDRLAAAGHKRVLLAPIGFVSDHVEILYDVDILFRGYAEGKGMVLNRTESLNENPLLVEALAAIARHAVGAPTRAAGREG